LINEEENYELFASSAVIKDTDYHAVDVAEVTHSQKHVASTQHNELQSVLEKFTPLFNGKLVLRVDPHKKIHLDLIPNSKPIHSCPYRVPIMHHEVFKKELKHLVEVEILEHCGATEWAPPTFIIPKNNQTVRWVSDFRAVNKCLRRCAAVYPLPITTDILTCRPGYAFFSKLDLSMQYYTFELDFMRAQISLLSLQLFKVSLQMTTNHGY
jgi:hypothetical protein